MGGKVGMVDDMMSMVDGDGTWMTGGWIGVEHME